MIKWMAGENLCSVILAGGDQNQQESWVETIVDCGKLKQFCTFVGSKSMLEHTLNRVISISHTNQRYLVINRSQLSEVDPKLLKRLYGEIIVQPSFRNTAAEIFLALSYVRSRTHGGLAAFFPSDHFIYPEERFTAFMQSALKAAMQLKSYLVLLGAAPEKPEVDYGYLQPGAHLGWIEGCNVRKVEALVDKPTLLSCQKMISAGALWNTGILVTRVDALWELGWRYLPEIMTFFEDLSQSIGTPRESDVLEAIYEEIPSRNFSADFLRHLTNHTVMMELRGVKWSDWGKPERIIETLRQMNKSPVFTLTQSLAS